MKLKKKEKKNYKHLSLIIVLVVLLLLLLIVAIFILKPRTNVIEKFSYNNLNFLVEDFGKTNEGKRVLFYHTEVFFPKYNLTYRLYLRYDPRENKVPVDLEELKVIKSPTYISIDKNFDGKNCSEVLVASYKLGEFLTALQVKGEVAVWYPNWTEPTYNSYLVIPDYAWANQHNVTVIVLKYNETNESSSRVYNNNDTVIIESNNCNILEAEEKFTLFVIEKLIKLGSFKPKKFEEIENK
ncbi:MAG: hypothetical protein QW622_01880 [Candidatus Pacearchaeota archaeon]